MRILILSFYYKPDLSAGSFRSTALVESLTALYPEVEVDVVTTMPNRYGTYEVSAQEEEHIGSLRIKRIPIPKHSSGLGDQVRSFLTYFWAANKYAKSIPYDVVFATSSRLFTAFSGALIANRNRKKLYLDIRDIFRESIGDVLKSKAKYVLLPILSAVESYTFRSANHINLVSKGFTSYFSERYPHLTYTYYTNGIDGEFIPQGTGERNGEAGSTQGSRPIRLVYAGNVGDGQGLHIITPRLAQRLGDQVEIVIIGDGGKHAELEASVESLGNVRLLPPVPRTELRDIYHSADILFLHLNDYPAFKRVLPSKIFEYAASGKPILAGVGGYAAAFLQENVTNVQVFAPNDEEAGSLAFDRLKLGYTDRHVFIESYNRMKIMHGMARDIVQLGH